MTAPAEPAAQYKDWSADDLATLIALYPTHNTVALAQQLGRSPCAVRAKATILRIGKSPLVIAQQGRAAGLKAAAVPGRMASLGAQGGRKGAAARAAKLSPEQRRRIAQTAARARWDRPA